MAAERGPVVLVSGPAGAGKTSVVDHLARTMGRPAVHVSLDDVRDMVKCGYANPEDGWSPSAERQYELARATCADLARRYTAAGYFCFVDDAVFPDWPEVGLDRWRSELAGLEVGFAVFLPRFDVLVTRNAHRRGTRLLSEDVLRIIHDRMLPWRDRGVPVIDNSDLSVPEAAEELRRLVRTGEVFAPFNGRTTLP
ncbi:AAA family ATPase [Saccharothrix obliqua]|uniref:AAA family ATPase n=1 Tax=Saccharothrix obliqua TaxID=2861747 RepID=UPI001C5D1B2A|nr:AAA family ATPase [Saccharothrix obliqua]MBW4718593.1 ATP-binding protein [Saccharothrix obliqua]